MSSATMGVDPSDSHDSRLEELEAENHRLRIEIAVLRGILAPPPPLPDNEIALIPAEAARRVGVSVHFFRD